MSPVRPPQASVATVSVAAYATPMQVQIKCATAADAKAVVLRAVRETNARDYPASVIDRLASTLPEKVASKLEEWHAYVATVGNRIVGTRSLNGQIVSSVFVHPDYQRQGIGSQLMDAIESIPNIHPGNALTVQSSITAEAFYAKRGFKVVREAFHGEERTIFMSKAILVEMVNGHSSPAPLSTGDAKPARGP
jgi:GNAT superfamily N-acetyltransferase